MKQAPKVQGWVGYISLPYISDLLSSELDFVFLEELSAQEREKRRDIENTETNGRGEWWGKEWIMIKLNRANIKYEHHRWQHLE